MPDLSSWVTLVEWLALQNAVGSISQWDFEKRTAQHSPHGPADGQAILSGTAMAQAPDAGTDGGKADVGRASRGRQVCAMMRPRFSFHLLTCSRVVHRARPIF